MLTYNMDVTPESVWKRTTPSEAELAQPYYCTGAQGSSSRGKAMWCSAPGRRCC